MASPVPPHHTPPANSPGMLDDGSGHKGGPVKRQDWWARLSDAQIELLRPLSTQLFEKLDDELFDRSGSASLPQVFFDGMRILRRGRDVLTQPVSRHRGSLPRDNHLRAPAESRQRSGQNY